MENIKKNFLLKISLFFAIFWFVCSGTALAQTATLAPASLPVAPNSNFSLNFNVSSVSSLFGVAFDLDFNPALIQFVSATEGSFLNQGCQTSLMTVESPAGKLIFGITRLGASCGGASGSGTLATLNFRSLGQAGTGSLTFSNNEFCLLSNSVCNYVVGFWAGATATIGTGGVVDTTPPAAPTGLAVN